MRVKLLMVLLSISYSILGQDISIGIFNTKKIKKAFIEVSTGKYKVKVGSKSLYILKNSRSLIIDVNKQGVSVSNSKKGYGTYSNISIIAKKRIFKRKKNIVSVKLVSPKLKSRQYSGNLDIIAKNGLFKIINKPPFQDYLAGVVEAESGTKAESEYYKNQAIICRTYALKSIKKHRKDGFNLCDGVHCQAYKGVATANTSIVTAVKRTKNKVIVDENNKLISALFSANCGGQTCNSEDVWSSKVSYLRSINDKYCTDQRQANWRKIIPIKDFKKNLTDNGIILSEKNAVDSFEFKQAKRLVYYTINKQNIKLTKIRYGLHLRSTFFDIEVKGNNLLFKGKGYGHGVGMCQEGAMNMAKKGKKYDDIIKHYYKNVRIKSLKSVDYIN